MGLASRDRCDEEAEVFQEETEQEQRGTEHAGRIRAAGSGLWIVYRAHARESYTGQVLTVIPVRGPG